MPTEKQIAANRENAQKSTGQKTPEGRAAVRLNGIKHGLTASALVLAGESESDFENLLDSMQAEHQPSTATEEVLVTQIAMAAWRLRRLHHIEAGVFVIRTRELGDWIERHPDLDPASRPSFVLLNDARDQHPFVPFPRYQPHLQRS